MIAGIRVASAPVSLVIWILSHFMKTTHNPPVSTFLGAFAVLGLLAGAIFGGRWFLYLYYRGELLGYRPDAD
jgi:hypothetical protein